jgi:hypothetical protein
MNEWEKLKKKALSNPARKLWAWDLIQAADEAIKAERNQALEEAAAISRHAIGNRTAASLIRALKSKDV